MGDHTGPLVWYALYVNMLPFCSGNLMPDCICTINKHQSIILTWHTELFNSIKNRSVCLWLRKSLFSYVKKLLPLWKCACNWVIRTYRWPDGPLFVGRIIFLLNLICYPTFWFALNSLFSELTPLWKKSRYDWHDQVILSPSTAKGRTLQVTAASQVLQFTAEHDGNVIIKDKATIRIET